MKVLYFSDNYGNHNMGTKKSIFLEMEQRGHIMIWRDKRQIGSILLLIKTFNPNMVWLAHSGLVLPPGIKEKVKIPIVGFGFSDPYYFKVSRFGSYDCYVTNHKETFYKHMKRIPMIYNPTACDTSFHISKPSPKKIDISIIGLGKHPRFKIKNSRILVAKKLREAGIRVKCYGRHWPEHPDNFSHVKDGSTFLDIINQSRLGLDIQDSFSPLAHRMLEYSACGVPVLTRDRPEVRDFFSEGEIFFYEKQEGIPVIVKELLGKPSVLKKTGERAMIKSVSSHNITNRVDNLLAGLKSVFN